MFARTRAVVLALVCLMATTAVAQTPPTRIRGTIASLAGQTLSVATRQGTRVDVTLNEPLSVAAVKRFELSDIGSGTYVGIATRTGSDGVMRALEVLVFPEAMRGAGEGHYPWDLEPGSMMTNGTVTGTVQGRSGRELSLAFKGANNTIVVPPEAPVVTFIPAERADLKPGVPVFLIATTGADGKLAASRVTVGKDGVAPPM
jgi:hypothetical protein